MAENIVQSMFGPTPYQIQQQQYEQDQARANAAAEAAGQTPGQMLARAYSGMGSTLGRAGAGMLGMVNPQVEEARQRERIMSQGGMDMSAEGLNAKAEQFRQAGDMQTAMRFKLAAQAQVEKEQEIALKRAQELKASAEAEKATRQESKYKNTPLGMFDIEKGEYVTSPKGKSGVKHLGKGWFIDSEGNRFKDEDMAADFIPASISKAEEKKAAEEKKQIQSADYLFQRFDETENAMADSLGIPVEKLDTILTEKGGKSAAKTLEKAVGSWEKFVHPAMRSQVKVNILSHIERLKSLAQTGGLAELRKAGIAPGSITEREWPKFAADLGNIDPDLSGDELVKQYIRILQKMRNKRVSLKEEIGQTDSTQEQEFNVQTPDQVKELVRSNRMTRDEAKVILKDMEKRGIKIGR